MPRKFALTAITLIAIYPVASRAKEQQSAPLIPVAEFDPSTLLPPPPTPASRTEKWELDTLHRIESTRTPEEFARAEQDNKTKDASIFAEAMGPAFDMARLPATQAVIALVRTEEKAVAARAKSYFHRSRPWIVDPSLHVCSRDDGPQTSYPSGHATMGFAMALVLARLAPRKAPAILARAADYAENRLVCGMHFPSDVAAAEGLGAIVVDRLFQQPEFQQRAKSARMELAQAGLN